MLAVAAVLTLIALGAWELKVRAWGYTATYNDTPNLWASRRALAVGAKREQIVFVGSSRTLFDIDLQAFREATGGPMPIQLATVGSNPLPVLNDLADDVTYAGTTIVGIVPGLLAAAGGPPLSMPMAYVKKHQRWSPSNRWELPISLWFQDQLAFLNQADLALPQLIDDLLGQPNRAAVYAPESPPSMYTLDGHRRARLVAYLARDPLRIQKVQQIWLPLFSPPPRPPIFSPEKWAQMMEDGLLANLARAKKNVAAIAARGGRVVFIRLPSSGPLRVLERKRMPPEKVWEPLLRETGAPGIHFESYEELRGFTCPEWSHLSAPDSVVFTRRLIAVMQSRALL